MAQESTVVAGESSVVADGMRIDWDVPIEMDDGVILRADVYRPVEEGGYPVIMTLGPYAKGLPFQTGYAGMWKILETKYPDVTAGSTNKYQNWETVDPEKWVPDGYVLCTGRLARRGALTRLPRRLFAAREPRLLPLHRVGGRAAVVQQQGRAARHLVLRRQPVAGRPAPASAPGRDVPVGGLPGLLPRLQPARRHSQHLHARVVPGTGDVRSVWERQQHREPEFGRARRRRRGPRGRRARAEPERPSKRASGQRARRPVVSRSVRRPPEDHGSAALSGELGALPALSGEFRGLRLGELGAEMAGGARDSSTGQSSTPTTGLRSRSGSSAISSKARTRAGTSSRPSSSTCARSTEPFSGAPSRSGRSPGRGGPSSTSIPPR